MQALIKGALIERAATPVPRISPLLQDYVEPIMRFELIRLSLTKGAQALACSIGVTVLRASIADRP